MRQSAPWLTFAALTTIYILVIIYITYYVSYNLLVFLYFYIDATIYMKYIEEIESTQPVVFKLQLTSSPFNEHDLQGMILH